MHVEGEVEPDGLVATGVVRKWRERERDKRQVTHDEDACENEKEAYLRDESRKTLVVLIPKAPDPPLLV